MPTLLQIRALRVSGFVRGLPGAPPAGVTWRSVLPRESERGASARNREFRLRAWITSLWNGLWRWSSITGRAPVRLSSARSARDPRKFASPAQAEQEQQVLVRIPRSKASIGQHPISKHSWPQRQHPLSLLVDTRLPPNHKFRASSVHRALDRTDTRDAPRLLRSRYAHDATTPAFPNKIKAPSLCLNEVGKSRSGLHEKMRGITQTPSKQDKKRSTDMGQITRSELGFAEAKRSKSAVHPRKQAASMDEAPEAFADDGLVEIKTSLRGASPENGHAPVNSRDAHAFDMRPAPRGRNAWALATKSMQQRAQQTW